VNPGDRFSSLELPSGSAADDDVGRLFPSAILIPAPGCYFLEVIGKGFEDCIVFEAVSEGG